MSHSDFRIRAMTPADVDDVVALQAACFPPPFSSDLHWRPRHLIAHMNVFPEGQLVAASGEQIVASCTNGKVSEAKWQQHGTWMDTIGGPNLEGHELGGEVLVGLDIAVHPDWRGKGVAKALYQERFNLVRSQNLTMYGTVCRLPDFQAWSLTHGQDVDGYAEQVSVGKVSDRTMTPLMKCGLTYVGVIRDYMEDIESGNAAAILEWRP